MGLGPAASAPGLAACHLLKTFFCSPGKLQTRLVPLQPWGQAIDFGFTALYDLLLFPTHQTLTDVRRVQPQSLTNVIEGKKPIAVLIHNPLLRLTKHHLPLTVTSKDVLLKTGNRILQNRQHEPLL